MNCTTLRNGKKGFTLMELLIVIIVIAVLAAIALPKFVNSGARSKEAALKSNLKIYRNAITLFTNDTGAYPATLAALAATSAPASGLDATGATKSINATDWKGPYVQTIAPDPVSGSAVTYSVATGTVGNVSSSASGNDSAGVAFSTY